MDYLVVGLGNPGTQYGKTRHNVGWIVIDTAYHDLQWSRDSYAHAGVARYERLALAKPQTFMNESGSTVGYLAKKLHLSSDHIIVIYDDIDLVLGTMKISFDRGSGGHNGIKSIEAHLGSREFIRIRIGISKLLENGDLAKPNVLGNFETLELKAVQSLGPKVRQAIKTIVEQGREKAMTEFNQ